MVYMTDLKLEIAASGFRVLNERMTSRTTERRPCLTHTRVILVRCPWGKCSCDGKNNGNIVHTYVPGTPVSIDCTSTSTPVCGCWKDGSLLQRRVPPLYDAKTRRFTTKNETRHIIDWTQLLAV